MQGDIVAQGIELMLYGMGTVVLFLALLVVATTAMSRFITRYFPEPQSSASQALQRLRGGKTAASTAPGIKENNAAVPPERVAVIAAAIHRYRTGQQQ